MFDYFPAPVVEEHLYRRAPELTRDHKSLGIGTLTEKLGLPVEYAMVIILQFSALEILHSPEYCVGPTGTFIKYEAAEEALEAWLAANEPEHHPIHDPDEVCVVSDFATIEDYVLFIARSNGSRMKLGHRYLRYQGPRPELWDVSLKQAVEFTCSREWINSSVLRRAFIIGYKRAVELLNIMESPGIVGADSGGKAGHPVLLSLEEARKRLPADEN